MKPLEFKTRFFAEDPRTTLEDSSTGHWYHLGIHRLLEDLAEYETFQETDQGILYADGFQLVGRQIDKDQDLRDFGPIRLESDFWDTTGNLITPNKPDYGYFGSVGLMTELDTLVDHDIYGMPQAHAHVHARTLGFVVARNMLNMYQHAKQIPDLRKILPI